MQANSGDRDSLDSLIFCFLAVAPAAATRQRMPRPAPGRGETIAQPQPPAADKKGCRSPTGRRAGFQTGAISVSSLTPVSRENCRGAPAWRPFPAVPRPKPPRPPSTPGNSGGRKAGGGRRTKNAREHWSNQCSRAFGDGGAEEIRTPDPHNAIVVLYQLSYDPIPAGDATVGDRPTVSKSFRARFGFAGCAAAPSFAACPPRCPVSL